MAAATAHTATPVAVSLKRSADRKVTQLVRVTRTKQEAKLANSFGLPAGLSCPGRTEFCTSCYAESLEKAYTNISVLLHRNYLSLLACDGDVVGMATLLDEVVSTFHADFIAARRSGRVSGDPIFRIHWDGDFFSAEYAKAWAIVIARHPSVMFWAYTRSFGFVGLLVGIENLTLYLSVDEHNVKAAGRLLKKHPTLHVAYCADTQADARVLAESLGRRTAPCPENVGVIPLVVDFGRGKKSTPEVGNDGQGACAACRICVDGTRDVSFAVKKR